MSLDEKQLILRVAEYSDERAFRQLFERYYAPLVQYSSYITGCFSLAEEIVSEVFVNLWKNRAKLAEVKNLKQYVYASTKNRTIDHIRQAKNLTFISLDKKDFEEYIIYDNPEKKYLEEEIKLKLQEVILKLPEKCRMIYRLVKEDQMKYQDVAELLDISPKTVENQMIIAMRRIREEIAAYYLPRENHRRFMFVSSLLVFFLVL